MHGGAEADRIVRVSLTDAAAFLIRGFVPALLLALAAAAAAYLVASRAEPTYRAVAIVLATRAPTYPGGTVLVPPQIDPSTYRTAILEGPLLAEALAETTGAPPDAAALQAARRRVAVRVEDGLVSSIVRIEVRSAAPDRAAALADRLAAALLAWDRDRVATNVAATVDAQRRALAQIDAGIEAADAAGDAAAAERLRAARDDREAALEDAEALARSGAALGLLEPFRAAETPTEPVDDRTVAAAAIAFLLGFLGTYAALLLRRLAWPIVRTLDDAEAVAGTAVVPIVALGDGRDTPTTDAAIGRLHVRLRPRDDANGVGRAVLLASPRPGRDRSATAVRLAESLAEAGHAVLLVDADLTTTTVTRLLHPDAHATSLYALLDGSGPTGHVATAATRGGAGYDVIPSFHRTTHALPAFDAGMRDLTASWRAAYDVVLIDGAPLLAVADAQIVAGLVDDVVLVLTAGRTTVDDAHAALATLREAATRPILSVLTLHPRRLARAVARRGAAPAATRDGGEAGDVAPYRGRPDRSEATAAPRR